MKFIILSSLMAFSSLSWATFPAKNGTFTGTGQLVRFGDGTAFSYNVTYVIANNAITASYVYPNGFSYSLPFTTQDTTLGQFGVYIQGQPVGSGYCVNLTCHVDAAFPLNGILQKVSLEFAVNPNGKRMIIGGKNATTNTAFEDAVDQ